MKIKTVKQLKAAICEWQANRGEIGDPEFRVKEFQQMAEERRWPLVNLRDWRRILREEIEFTRRVADRLPLFESDWEKEYALELEVLLARCA